MPDPVNERLILAGQVAASFEPGGIVTAVHRLTHGRIHDSFVVSRRLHDHIERSLLQRINDQVFADPPALMENILRITQHLRGACACADVADPERRVLTVLPTRTGMPFFRDAQGGYWRQYAYIEGSLTRQSMADPAQARDAARSFGEFAARLSDLPAPRLTETIPGFHDTPARLQGLWEATSSSAENRVQDARDALAFAERHASLAEIFSKASAQGELPERVVHNDTKISNILFDAGSGEALCVVDLDTAMPGPIVHDFGDLARSSLVSAVLEPDAPQTVESRLPLLNALLGGYLEGTGRLLTSAEIDLLPISPSVLAYELGIRYLTDYLLGDRYFPVNFPTHNLDRCWVQFRLVAWLEIHGAIIGQSLRQSLDENPHHPQ